MPFPLLRFSPGGGFSRPSFIARALLACVLAASVLAGPANLHSRAASREPLATRLGMVVSADPLASEAGLRVLQSGGTAVDAAVAVGFALAVVLPSAGNIGGGGFMLYRDGVTGATSVIDFRETAPAAASPGMYLGADGEALPDLSRHGYLSVAVPGTVAGLAAAHDLHGIVPWRRLVRPAIGLARRGFPVLPGLERDIRDVSEHLARSSAASRLFLPGGRPLTAGSILRQPDLARTLEIIARRGPEGFYAGPVAEAIVDDVRGHGGILTLKDLAAYRPRLRKPLEGTYGEYRILTVPPPSSGGVILLEILNMLEPYHLGRTGFLSSRTVHLMAEAGRRAFADRAALLGDPDYFDVPVDALVSKQYAISRRADISLERATPSSAVGPGRPVARREGPSLRPRTESPDTTHFAVVDRWRNIAAVTYTLNDQFGAKVVAGSTGVVLNDEMDDFSAKPGAANLYGLVGGEANEIRPGKRPLSSMSPTIVLRNNQPFLVIGTPGGSTIITSVAQVFLNIVEHGMGLQEAVDAPRVHHQWIPDRITIEERSLAADVRIALERMGHTIHVRENDPIGDLQAIRIDPARGWVQGASDPRGDGAARGY